MTQQRALVGNAADPKQVKNAGQREKALRRQELAELRWVLSDRRGRRFLWKHLSTCGIYTTPYHPSGSTVYHNVGRGDVGRELLAQILEADQAAYLLMQQEAMDDERRDPFQRPDDEKAETTSPEDERKD
jgi:hypothetical protein